MLHDGSILLFFFLCCLRIWKADGPGVVAGENFFCEPVVMENQDHRLRWERMHEIREQPLASCMVKACRRLVEQQDFLWMLEQGADGERDEDALALATREAGAVLAERRVDALRKFRDEFITARDGERALTAGVGGIRQQTVKILADRAGEHEACLRGSSERSADFRDGALTVRPSEKFQRTAVRLPEPRQQMKQRRLPRAALPEQQELFVRMEIERDVLENRRGGV